MIINFFRFSLKLASICILLALTVGAQDQGLGLIRGTVVDENGIPLSGAMVKANSVAPAGLALHTLMRYVVTDAAGHFSIDRLKWGRYKIFAKKEDSAYPDTFFSFYDSGIVPEATITPTAPTADIVIRLGPKAAVMTGSVSNAETGAPVNAGFKLIRAGSPNDWISTSVPASYRVLLPSSVDVLVEVSASGYKTWISPIPLRLQGGTEMRLDIPLQPAHDPGLHPSKFLIPDGYAGWLLLEYNVKDAQPVAEEGQVKVFRFPANGVLNTCSAGPERGADDEYYYYSADGSLRRIPADYRNGAGMIWGQHEGTRNGELSQFGFFVGTEEQYKKFQTQVIHPGPIPAP